MIIAFLKNWSFYKNMNIIKISALLLVKTDQVIDIVSICNDLKLNANKFDALINKPSTTCNLKIYTLIFSP